MSTLSPTAAAPRMPLDDRPVETTRSWKLPIGYGVFTLLALVLFGFFPSPLLDVINPVVHDTLVGVGIGQEAKEAGHQ